MRIVLQRVTKASVTVDGKICGQINSGLLALTGFSREDSPELFNKVIDKILNLRIFANSAGKFDFSLLDIKGEILLVPQFTLFADISKGRRPEFFTALEPKSASVMFDQFISHFKTRTDLKVESGIFGADMKVELLNDGPVTIVFDSSEL